jgi:hypothetical protein
VRSQLIAVSGVEVADFWAVKSRDPLSAATAIWTVINSAPQATDLATKLIDSTTELLRSSEVLHSAFVEIRLPSLALDWAPSAKGTSRHR